MKEYYSTSRYFIVRELWWNPAVAIDVCAGMKVKSVSSAEKRYFLLLGKSAFTVVVCHGTSASGF